MIPYEDTRSATADGTGRAEIRWEFQKSRKLLNVNRISLRATGSDTPQAAIYRRGIESDSFFVAGTFTGNQDTAVFPTGHLEITPWDPILIVWVNASAGAECTMTIEGYYE